jgi:HSP20 family protein
MSRQSDPFDEIERIFEMMGGQLGDEREGLAVDVIDDGDSFVVVADLPGFEREELTVKLTGERTLYLGADRSTDEVEDTGRYVTRERRQESVTRTVSLPEPVSEDGTEAAYDAGVLRVTLPKQSSEPETGTDIPVN